MAQASIHETIESTNSHHRGLKAMFWRSGDRHQHSIIYLDNKNSIELLQSVEGDGSDIWPSSPPLQQIHKQTVESAHVILGVGMAGKSHFSSSLKLGDSPSIVQLEVESACLSKSDSGDSPQLVNTYQVFGDPTLDCNQIIWDRGGQMLKLELLTQSKLEFDDGLLRVSPIEVRFGQATQWGFKINVD